MGIGIAFYVLWIVWGVFGVASNWSGGGTPPWVGGVGNLLMFVLFVLLAWHNFGAPIHG